MNDMAAGLDPILEARLDLLAQVLDEVKDIRTAMVDQTQRLETLAHFLRRNGDLTKLHNSMLVDAGDAETRLKVLVQAGRDQLDTDLLDHDPEDQADEADHATSASRSASRRRSSGSITRFARSARPSNRGASTRSSCATRVPGCSTTTSSCSGRWPCVVWQARRTSRTRVRSC